MALQAVSEAEAPVEAETSAQPASLYFTTILGLLFAFSALLGPIPELIRWLLGSMGISTAYGWECDQIVYKLIIGSVIVGIVMFAERRPLSALGLYRPAWSDVGLGLALFIAILAAEAIYTVGARLMFPHAMSKVAADQFKRMMAMPVGLSLLVALAAGVVEEIAERGFALARLFELSGSLAFAGVATLALSLGAHIPYWGWRYALLLVPAESMLVLMYIWRRSVMPNIVAHALIDGLPVALRVAGASAFALAGSVSLHATLASFRFDQADYKGAIAEYTLGLRSRPHDPKLLRYRANAERYDRDFAAAIADLDEILARNPKDVDALIDRSEVYLGAGYYDRAQADADEAVSLAPKEPSAYGARAYVYDHRGEYDEAIADLGQQIKYTRRKDADLYYRRGFAYQEKRDYDHALADLSEAIRLAPDNFDAVGLRAQVYQTRKQYDLAIADYARAAEIAPTSYWPYYELGEIHEQRGEYQLELYDFRKAAALAPESEQAANALAWVLSTCPDGAVRDGKLALKYANQACELSSWNEWGIIDTLAAAYAENGNYPEAATWEQRSVDLMKSASADEQRLARERLDLYQHGKPYRDLHPPQ